MARLYENLWQNIDWQLEIAEFEWQQLPEVEAEIDQWDWIDQIVFIEEWPLQEERLLFLERSAAQGLMSPEQLARYEALKRLVEQNRPIIRRLQES